ncbi:LacI family transcriptional regulator [Crossiella equi]|uniref:LacI family transcriptional regulator n=1 Tax=Crossiella equi TaxID=130796 RepID=A0ABS5AQP6_9PSEU|nr:LacI family DNA-binding transcriptional regulator [Crossiella equi]MBP2478888.1 LacI family transcriptional regulator [Crossiella equi]
MGTEQRRVTIHDVAAAAGVSRQTVSRALNDKPEIDERTKARVLAAARELGYRPSRFARGLVRQDTTTVGLVVPDLRNPFFTEVAASALEAARARDWHVVVHDTADSPEEEVTTLRVIGGQVDAVVGYFSQPEEEIERHLPGLPVVFLGRRHHGPRFRSIRIDGADGMAEAVAHLKARGHTHLGMLDHKHRPEPSERRDWFLHALARHGYPPERAPVLGAVQSVDGGAQAFSQLRAAHPEVTAVLTFNDVIAVGALRQARRDGLAVPERFAVVGFDGLELGEIVDPPLTTVDINTHRLGELAIHAVGNALAGVAPRPEEQLVRGTLRVRGSA